MLFSNSAHCLFSYELQFECCVVLLSVTDSSNLLDAGKREYNLC